MQTKESQPKGKRITPETRFTKIQALSIGPRVEGSRSASETDDGLFFLTYNWKKHSFYNNISIFSLNFSISWYDKIDRWMMQFYVLFKNISVISSQWVGDNGWVPAMEPHSLLKRSPPQGGLEPRTARSVGQRFTY